MVNIKDFTIESILETMKEKSGIVTDILKELIKFYSNEDLSKSSTLTPKIKEGIDLILQKFASNFEDDLEEEED